MDSFDYYIIRLDSVDARLTYIFIQQERLWIWQGDGIDHGIGLCTGGHGVSCLLSAEEAISTVLKEAAGVELGGSVGTL